MSKIKIALLMYSLDCGGIEKAAVSILRALPIEEYEVHLIMNHKRGAFLNLVPNYVHIHELKVSDKYKKRIELGDKRWLFYSLCKGDIVSFYRTLLFILRSVFASKDWKLINRIAQQSKEIKFDENDFDFVLAYSNNEQLFHAVNYYRTKFIVTWLHRDIDLSVEDSRKYAFLYDKCIKIFGVSQKVVDDFVHVFPKYKSRTCVHYNLLDEDLALDLSTKIDIEHPNKKWWLLTVARLDEVKGMDIVPDIALKLKSAGIDFAWSIVGNGYLMTRIQEKITKYGLENEVILEGEKENPYPYYKGCDIYIQPSRQEGYCISVAEARMFHKPMIVTDFAGAREQLENGKCGKIVTFGVDNLADGIIEVIKDSKLQEYYKEGLSKQKIDTTDTITVLTDFFRETINK